MQSFPSILFCKGVAETYGGRLYICKNYTGSDCTSINFRAVPELYSQMYSLGLMLKRCEHKVIPSQYKKGTAEVRRKVLAGLLDTDGSASNNCYDFISKSKQLSEDVVFIARSLGMRAVMRPSEKFCQTGGGGTYWRVCISGEGLDKLPMLLSRKKSRPRKQIKDARRFGFTITDLPEDDFYGFTLDGDGRFTLSNFIITHNTGKTYVGINAAKRLDLPVGIVCPKSVIPSWERVCASEGVEPAFIANYEKLVHGNTDIVSRKRRAFTWNFGGIVLFDEVDRCKSHTSLAGRLLTSAWESRLIRCHCMSATAAQNPMEMRALGFVLGLHNDYDFFKWVQEKGAKKNRWDQYVCAPTPEVMEQIHHAIFPARGVRVRISDLGNAFPENQVLVENLAIADIAEVNAAYAEAQELLMALNAKAEHDTTNAFTIILRARQRAELAKIPVLVEQAENLLREGASVAIFVNFNDTLEAVAKHLNTDCVVRAQKAEDRKKNLDAFQSNESRVIVLNTQAGGVGVNLHDVHGGHRRVSLLCPSYNARNLKQALGRIHRSGAKSPCVQKLIFAAGTVEDRVAASIRSKLQAMDKLNDNDLDDGLSWYLQQL